MGRVKLSFKPEVWDYIKSVTFICPRHQPNTSQFRSHSHQEKTESSGVRRALLSPPFLLFNSTGTAPKPIQACAMVADSVAIPRQAVFLPKVAAALLSE